MDAKSVSQGLTQRITQESRNVLEAARAARLDVEAANCDVEELIWEIQHVRLGRQRIVFSIAGFDDDDRAPN